MYEKIKDLILKTGLTAEQIIYLMCLHKGDNLLSVYPKQQFFRGDLREMLDKGYIVGSVETPLNNVITPLGSEIIFIDEDEAANEIWDLYPNFFGDRYQTKSMDKEVFIMLYQQKIQNLRIVHEELVELLKTAIEYGWINRKIEMWIRSEQWNEWKTMLNEMKQTDNNEFK